MVDKTLIQSMKAAGRIPERVRLTLKRFDSFLFELNTRCKQLGNGVYFVRFGKDVHLATPAQEVGGLNVSFRRISPYDATSCLLLMENAIRQYVNERNGMDRNKVLPNDWAKRTFERCKGVLGIS